MSIVVCLSVGHGRAFAGVRMATYTPIPMQSTSTMPLPSSGMDISSTQWEKPGTWSDPGGEEEGGGSGWEKPGEWSDPNYDGNPTPIGDGCAIMLAFAAGFCMYRKKYDLNNRKI